MSLETCGALSSLSVKQEEDKDGQPAKIEGKIYKDYLMLDTLLNNVDMMSAKHGTPIHDEHLFISEFLSHRSSISVCV